MVAGGTASGRENPASTKKIGVDIFLTEGGGTQGRGAVRYSARLVPV